MKLRKLILSGFKSFADRTELDFDEGISGIVGPNGCGKSNIVDAIKWVLGERSAKSLRGSEMMDVIFNGSATRKPAGMAEVTLVFENDRGLLRTDIAGQAPGEGLVSVGRRLYRSGQSEYLVNRTPCRLKDIREMFMDTGVGVEAYSLIEQGKVEVFLQASQDERRSIFDEAAGISKYKARKKEALRRLERVEQNLLRIQDILSEVQKRLRSIKVQAGKARSYQAYTERLKELRMLYFLAQYHILSQQRRQLQGRLDEQTDALAALAAKADRLESARSATEVEMLDLERSRRDLEARIAALGAQVTAAQERSELLSARARELGDQIVQGCARCEGAEAKIAQHDADAAAMQGQLAELERRLSETEEEHAALREEHSSGQLAIAHLQARLDDEKSGTIDLLRRTAQLHSEIRASTVRREGLHGQTRRLQDRADEIAASVRRMLTDRARAEEKLRDATEVLGAVQTRLEDTRRSAHEVADDEQGLLRDLSAGRERRSAVRSRIDTLDEMLARREGVETGTRRVLEARREGKLSCIRGMLGDFLETDVAHAALVEAALAGLDQVLLVERCGDLLACREELREVLGEAGTVEVLCLDRVEPFRSDVDASGIPCTIGRLIDFVTFPADLGRCAWALMGRTFVTATLADAEQASRMAPPGSRFVTRAGEVIEGDGRVRVGSAARSAGVVARRSELAELRRELEQLDAQIAVLEQRHASARTEREHLEELQQQLRTAIYEASTEKLESEGTVRRLEEQIAALQREEPLVAGDIRSLAGEIEQAVRLEHEAQEKAKELERLRVERESEVAGLESRIEGARRRQEELGARMTELRVALAEIEQKKRGLNEALASRVRQRRQMEQDIQSDRREIELNRQRRAEAEEGIRSASEAVEKLYAELEGLNRESAEAEESRMGLGEKLEAIRKELSEVRQETERAGERVASLRVELGEADVRIENLIARATDEVGMDLLKQHQGYVHDEQRDWEAVRTEIQDLHERIERLGNVNLDAIGEQEELEQRREFLDKQLGDVKESRDQLNELIRRLNEESRERFLESFEAVRGHFQELFRKLFGGGRADILLMDEQDVLESGIEIVARPPGKELRTLSLLSGGEKTMTALALLFSIFRAHPSPFCVLDEVDAALDEANTERFGKLLQEFISDSQFVVVTHAKRTMSMANVLYGVTMQEPGVSKRISVRFEDVGNKLDHHPETVGA